LQIGDPASIAEACDVDVVSDFRSADVAAGGQGAPLAPAFHAVRYGEKGKTVVVLNLGGIANVTVIEDAQVRLGCDLGPANCLMDAWCSKNTGRSFDENGAWANSGRVNEGLLRKLSAEKFFSLAAPKSTGKELFNLSWLTEMAGGEGQLAQIAPADVQATLLALTAQSATSGIGRAVGRKDSFHLVVCGGGAKNERLLAAFQRAFSSVEVASDGDWTEAMAFAWMASRRLLGEAANAPEVTGARQPRLLGSLTKATPRRRR